MSGVWHDLRRNVSALSAAAAETTGRLARRGVLTLDLVELRRSLAREHEALGRRVRALLAAGQAPAVAGDPDVRAILERIDDFEAGIARTQTAMAETHGPPAAASAPPSPSGGATDRTATASNT